MNSLVYESAAVELLRSFPSVALLSGQLAYGDGKLWQIDRRQLLILGIDPLSGRVLQTFEFVGEPAGMVFAPALDQLWVADQRLGLISCLTPQHGKLIGYLPLAPGLSLAGALAYDGQQLWHADSTAGRLMGIDLGSGILKQVVELDAHLSGIAFWQQQLYFVDSQRHQLASFDPVTLRLQRAYPLPGSPLGLASDGDCFWYLDARLDLICQLKLLV